MMIQQKLALKYLFYKVAKDEMKKQVQSNAQA